MFTTILAFLAPIGKWFSQIFKNNKVSTILAIICIILFFILNFVIKGKNNEIAALKGERQNLLAANDSIRLTFAKDKAIEFDKYAFIARKAEDLKKVNDSLYNKIKNTKGDVKAAIAVGGKLIDSGNLKTTVIKDSTKKDSLGNIVVDKEVELKLDTQYSPGNYHKVITRVHVVGVPDSLDIRGVLVRDEIGFTLFTGIKKNQDGNYEIFARPDYPGATITHLEGALIDKKIFEDGGKRRIFTVGASVGYVPVLYDWSTKQTSFFGSYLGATIGVNINFTEIFRKK